MTIYHDNHDASTSLMSADIHFDLCLRPPAALIAQSVQMRTGQVVNQALELAPVQLLRVPLYIALPGQLDCQR